MAFGSDSQGGLPLGSLLQQLRKPGRDETFMGKECSP